MNNLSSVLWTVAAILLVLWLVGMVSQTTLGGFVHVLLLLIVIAVVFELVRPKRT
jgi:hypothetical protein